MSKSEPVYLIDGSAYIYRAYHAIAPLSTADGLPTHAVYGFVNILLRVLREKKPRYLAVAFDVKGPNFRHELYPEYKANRPPMPDDLVPQIPYIKQVVEAYNLLSLEMNGVEADDLIASAATTLARAGMQVVVVSGDKDLLQLVSDRVIIWDPMKDLMMDIDQVVKKYNVRPEQLLDLFSLTGDKSDNIPGVPGIGPKTAEKLINEFGSLEKLFEGLNNVTAQKLREKLAAHREGAFLSRRLIDLRDDLDIPAEPDNYLVKSPDLGKMKELFSRLEFNRLLRTEVPAQAMDHGGFALVNTMGALQGLADRIAGCTEIVLDTETSSLDPLSAELVGISLAVGTEYASYIPIGHRDEDGTLYAEQLELDQVLKVLVPFIENPDLAKIGHNLKFDYSVLKMQGVNLAGPLLDTMIASYLVDHSRRTYKLDDLCREFLDLELTSFAEVTAGDKREDSFVYVLPGEAKNYSCEDVYGAAGLWDHFRPQLEKLGLWDLFIETEMALVPVLAEMELAGIEIDHLLLQDLSVEFKGRLAELEEEIFGMAGESFNVNSPSQLGEILFEKLGLPHGRKTKTGYSTDVKVLEKLSFHELPRTVILHRNLSKLKNTYIDKLASIIHPRTGRVHTSFNQTVTATGRLSSSNPNLQNIPIRTDEGQRIRQAFIAAEGCLFLSGDYSQIDLRVLAHYSQDKALVEAFLAGQDIHSMTAAEIFMVSPLLITSQMRRVAKTINFGIVYGMSSFGLASQLNLSRNEAQTFIDRYFRHYAGVKRFMEDIVVKARKDGFVSTLLNRRRSLPDINSANRNRREFAERTAINTPIQGTAADIIKLAMIRVDKDLKKAGLGAKMLLQIHDELVFEVPADEIDKSRTIVRKAMESVMKLDVPLTVNLNVGKNLAEV